MYKYDPESYESWYHTPRGGWIGDCEFALLMRMMHPANNSSLLNVGCGTGYFSRRFAQSGLRVTGIDPDNEMIAFAQTRDGTVNYMLGDALSLPFTDRSFDYCTAITSLCFIDDPVHALREMLRITRYNVTLGLLNRDSRLYKHKHGRGGYQGARWDSVSDIRRWVTGIGLPLHMEVRSAVFFPGACSLSRIAERWLPNRLQWGGFLAVRCSSI